MKAQFNLDRRQFLKLCGTGAASVAALLPAGGCGPVPEEEPKQVRRPNIILIVADDLGYGDVCGYSCKGLQTPNIDSIGSNGVICTDGHVTAPMCSPSRAGFITGRYQQRFGHEFNAGNARRCEEQGLGLPTSECTVADLLREAGYVTGMIGKSHLGSQPKFHPMERGFDEFFGFLHGANIYMDPPSGPGFHHVDTEVEARRESRDELHPILRGKEIVEEPEYLTDAFSREAVDFITRHKDEEFFLYLPYNAPHTPLQVTEKYYARFPHIEDERERIFAAMVSAVDDGIGWIFETLKKEGLWEDTMVIFFSDNGCATYTEACFNDPLLGGKLSLFEGGQRVPFMLQYPRELKGGQEYDRPVSSLDVLPTALMLGGGTIPENIDGIDLLPFLKGDITGDPHEALCWRVGDNSAVRQGDWKLVNLDKGKHILLYDLSTDIGELNDLASENPEKTEALSKLLADWEAELVEPLWPSRRIIPYEIEGLKFNLFV